MITIDVYDSDWDSARYEEVGDVKVLELGHLLITNAEDKPMACYAPGAWSLFRVVT